MEVLDISIANVALQHIAGDLAAGPDEATWVLTSYLVTNAIVLPLSGWLSTVLGRKRFLLACIAGFSVSSLACGLAPSLAVLICLRAVQGLTGGGLQPVAQAILNDDAQPSQRAMAFALFGMAVGPPPARDHQPVAQHRRQHRHLRGDDRDRGRRAGPPGHARRACHAAKPVLSG